LPHSFYLFAEFLCVLRYLLVCLVEAGVQLLEVFFELRLDLLEVLVGGVWSQVNVRLLREEAAQRRIFTLALLPRAALDR